MRIPPHSFQFRRTLLLASGSCLLAAGAWLSAAAPAAAAQTLPPQGVQNVTGSQTPDGPVVDAPTAAAATAPAASSSTSTAGGAPSAPASASTGTATTASTPSANAGQTATSAPITPSPAGTPSGTSQTQTPAVALTPSAPAAGGGGSGSGGAAAPATTSAAAPGSTTAGAAGDAGSSEELDPNTVYLMNADLLRFGDTTATLTGHVQIVYRAYTLYADRAVADVDPNTGGITRVIFDGNVRSVSSADKTSISATAPATRLILDTTNDSYSIEGAEHAVIDPDLLAGSSLLLPLRVDSKGAYSVSGILDARQGGFTTCDFLHPHYYVAARSVTIVPGKRVVARHAILYRRTGRLAEVNYLILPLNNRYDNATYLPLVGEDQTEGYFAKFAIPYALTGAALGVLRLDYMSSIGTGTGFDQSYQSHGPGAGGTLSLYRLDDRSTGLDVITGSLQHQQTVGNFKIGVNTQYENNSYDSASGASSNLNGTLNVSGTEGRNTTLFTSNLQQSNYGQGVSDDLTAALNQLDKLGGLNTLGIKLNYSATGLGTTSTNISGASVTKNQQSGTLGSDFDLHLQPDGLMMDLQTDLFTTLKNTTDVSLIGMEGLQRRPELMLTTTGKGSDPLDYLAELVHGSQIQLGLGQYIEPDAGIKNGVATTIPFSNNRLYFSYDGGSHARRVGDFTLSSDSSYQQAFYSDGGAQYLLDGRYGSAYTRGPVGLSANYSTLRSYGYTPFLFDRPGDYNNASFTAGYTPSKSVTYSAAVGYNFLQDRGVYMKEGDVNTLVVPAMPWQDLLATVNVHPSPLLNDQLQGSYDPNHGTLFNVTNSFYAANRSGFGLRTGFNYLPQHGRFGVVNAALDLPIILDQREQAGYKVQAIAGYNGATNEFTYQGVALTRSWHDFELTATYQNNPFSFGSESNTFSLTFHLKAFPGYQPFGVSATGQQLAGGVGAVY